MPDKYFFFIASFNRKSPDYMKPLSLIRLHYAENGGFHAERWNPKSKEWVFDRNGISACGNGGDNPYERISEAEALLTARRVHDVRRTLRLLRYF